MKVAKAVEDVLGDVRGMCGWRVADERTTVLSDIGILIVARKSLEIRRGYMLRSWRRRSIPMGYLGMLRSNSK